MANKHKPVDSLRHKQAERIHIPSREEAGQEGAAVAGKSPVREFPLNPVVHRGQDPELFWLGKYGLADDEERLTIDIRSLYRHEHVAPEVIIKRFYQLKANGDQGSLFINELFGNVLALDELDKPLSYYKQADKWQNRLIQGDSLLVMTSLLEREGMAGKVQCIYIDPPYGIKYGSNWQMRLNDRNVKDGADENLSGEPEVIKAFRDTWELGIHSYLSYLHDRLTVSQRLLAMSGSCFVQISDDNIHLVRSLLDETFGSENFVCQITYKTTSSLGGALLGKSCDYVLWYARDIDSVKFRQLFTERKYEDDIGGRYTRVELPDGNRRVMTADEKSDPSRLPSGARIYRHDNLTSQSGGEFSAFSVDFNSRQFKPGKGYWKTNPTGMARLIAANRIAAPSPNSLAYVRLFDDFPYTSLSNVWTDTQTGAFTEEKAFVVQTNRKVVERCLLMTTDPGDLVLDPTCGSGTTAYVAEQWGRRWITIDTSRIALNIAKTRLMTATYLWYKLADPTGEDLRHGFVYKKVPHVTLKSLANDEPPEQETLVDQPESDRKRMRVAGPFTVETLQVFEPVSPDGIDAANCDEESIENFNALVFEHLKSAGIKNGIRNEQAIFTRVDALTDPYLHAEGDYNTPAGEKKAYLHIGPRFGAVTKTAVNEAVKACRTRGDADWLVILGFAFETDVENKTVTSKVGGFEVTKVRMSDDLMQQGLLKRDKKAASFVTIGEPDINPMREGDNVVLEIRGLDIYDPIRDEVKPRSAADISYWMIDDDYDGANFIVRQVFFCGGDKDEFRDFQRGLSRLAEVSVRRQAQATLKIEIDDAAFERVYGFHSHPISYKKGKKVAVRVVSQFGEESTKVLTL